MDTIKYNAEQELELLSREENHFFDFKRGDIAPAKLQESAVAFANADGGELYIRIANDRNLRPADRIHGFRNEEAANNIVSIPERLMEPALLGSNMEFIRMPSKACDLVLHMIVPKSDKVHHTSNNECFKRKGAQNLKIRGKDIENLIFSKGQRSYEDTIADTVAAGTLKNSSYLKQYLSLVPSAQPATKFLNKQRLLDPAGHKNQLKSKVLTAAVLLFDDEPQSALSTRSGVKITRYQTTRAEYDRNSLVGIPYSVEGPTELLIKRSVAKIEEIMNASYLRIRGRYTKAIYPQAAIHEIVTNAVIHRDYSIKDDVHIAIYDNRIEITSPGRLPGHITPQNILDERFMRNPKMVRLLNKLPDPPNKDIGEGLNTAFREMQNARLKAPQIKELDSAVKVTLLHEPIASADQQVVEYLEAHPTIQNKEARKLTGRESIQSIYKVFQRLIASNVIQIVDPEASVYHRKYKLTTDWQAHWAQKKAKIRNS